MLLDLSEQAKTLRDVAERIRLFAEEADEDYELLRSAVGVHRQAVHKDDPDNGPVRWHRP